MRLAFLLTGYLGIICFSIYGALLLNVWEVTAGSGLPYEETIAGMDAAGKIYSTLPGIVFATIGIILASVWLLLSLFAKSFMTDTVALVTACAIVACGSVAYMGFSFGTMMSVGDSFYEWYPDAANEVVLPFYLIGAAALVACIATLIRAARKPRPVYVPQTVPTF